MSDCAVTRIERLTWYLRCCRLCLDLSEARSACESASRLRRDLKLLIRLVNAFSIALRIPCVSSYSIFWTKWSAKTRPAAMFQGDLGSPVMSIAKSAAVASQAFAPWSVFSHSVKNLETLEGSGVRP
jgi:hypothetical protein